MGYLISQRKSPSIVCEIGDVVIGKEMHYRCPSLFDRKLLLYYPTKKWWPTWRKKFLYISFQWANAVPLYIKTASSSNSNGSSHAVTKRKTMTRGKRRGELHSIGIAVRRASARSATRLARNGSSVRRTLANTLVNKYANRRTSLFKSNRPLKAPRRKATIRTHDSLWDTEGRLFRLGDIVSVLDEDDGLPYFGQIRGIISDTHGGQYAVLNWLIPMDTAFDAHQFDAEHFAHAIADETFYPFEVCSFVQTAPELPAYQREWTPRACAEEQLRREMSERLANLKAIASEKLRFMDASITADGSQSTRVMIA